MSHEEIQVLIWHDDAPPGESVVIIRGLIGNVELLVPFDAAVSVNHSTLSGKLKVFNHSEEIFHSNIIYYPDP